MRKAIFAFILASSLCLGRCSSSKEIPQYYFQRDHATENFLQSYESDLEKITGTDWEMEVKKVHWAYSNKNYTGLNAEILFWNKKNYEEGSITLINSFKTKDTMKIMADYYSKKYAGFMILFKGDEYKNMESVASYISNWKTSLDKASKEFMFDITKDSRLDKLRNAVRERHSDSYIEFSWLPFVEQCSELREMSLPAFIKYFSTYDRQYYFKNVMMSGEKASVAGYVLRKKAFGRDKIPFIENYKYSINKGWVRCYD